MNIQYYKHYSAHLNREMEFKVYGHGGKPMLLVTEMENKSLLRELLEAISKEV